jgi:ParB family chromosome partitioning protein
VVNDQSIEVASIDITDRLWLVSLPIVEALSDTIRKGGLSSSIVLREVVPGERPAPTYRLIVGAHQLAAVKLLGWTELTLGEQAFVLGRGDFDERILDVGYGLALHELRALDLALFLSECKALYEASNDVAGLGGDRRSQKFHERDIAEPFPLMAARRTGYSEGAIRKYLRISSRLDPTGIPSIRGSLIEGSFKELLALASLAPEAQLRALGPIMAGEASTVAAALRQG